MAFFRNEEADFWKGKWDRNEDCRIKERLLHYLQVTCQLVQN